MIIRGDETTSEDQVASASTPEIAQRLVACWNACAGMTMEELTVMALEARDGRRAR